VAGEAVEQTPRLLPVLAKAGVVDSGGKGLFYILEGMQRGLNGESMTPAAELPAAEAPPALTLDPYNLPPVRYGFDVQFLLWGAALQVDEIRRWMIENGDFALVEGSSTLVKVHVHVFDPSAPLAYGLRQGFLTDVVVENMDAMAAAGQTPDDVKDELSTAPGHLSLLAEHVGPIGVVAVAPGPGLAEVFESLGVGGVISGGQTMNPSIQELWDAVDALPTKDVVILPNNKNVILTAQQVPDLTTKNVHVIASRTIPQGISAMLSIRHDVDLATNLESMTEALGLVQTVELARAVRSVHIGELDVKEGQILGILNDEVTASGDDEVTVALEVFGELGIEDYEVLSVYYGSDVSLDQARQFAEAVGSELKAAYDTPVAIFLPNEERSRTALPFGTLRVELHSGGQPHYFYIMSVE